MVGNNNNVSHIVVYHTKCLCLDMKFGANL